LNREGAKITKKTEERLCLLCVFAVKPLNQKTALSTAK